MRQLRFFICSGLIGFVWLVLLITVSPVRADTFMTTESHTYSMRPGDTQATVRASARWQALDKAMQKVVTEIKKSGLPVMETGLEVMILKSVIVPVIDSSKCSESKCSVAVSAVVDSAQAYSAIESTFSRPDTLEYFIRAKKEGADALAEAAQLRLLLEDGDESAQKRYESAVMKGYAWNWYFLGSALLVRGSDFEALEAFDKFITLKPGFSRAYLLRGTIHAKLGRHEMALEDYDRAVALEPDDMQAYNNRGVARYNLKDYRRAILDFTRVLKYAPRMVVAYHNRGNAYLDSGDPNTAIKDYNKALELDPGYAEAYNSRGTAYNTLKMPDKALSDFTHASKLNPNYPDAFNNMGVSLHRKGMLKEAITNYDRAIELNATNAESHNNRGVALQQQGDLKRAHQDYTSAITLSSNYLGAYMNRAMLNMNVKNFIQACSDAATACRLGDCRVRDMLAKDSKCK